MRVRFTKDFRGDKGEESYTEGQVVDLDPGVAQMVIDAGVAEDFPRDATDVAEQAAKYHANDDQRTPAQLRERVPQVVLLDGDTKTATEQQRGTADTHELRKQDVETTAEVVEEKREDEAKAEKVETKRQAREK
jgi:protein-disulfide isomerase-like protein with CxxC motif